MYTDDDIKSLLSLFFKESSENNEDEVNSDIASYITNPQKEFLIEDENNLLNITSIVEDLTGDEESPIFTDKIINKEVKVTDDGYILKNLRINNEYETLSNFYHTEELTIKEEEGNNNEGKEYLLVAALIPNNINSTNLQDYDYLVIVLEDLNGVNSFSETLKLDMEKEFWILIFIIVGCFALLSIVITL